MALAAGPASGRLAVIVTAHRAHPDGAGPPPEVRDACHRGRSARFPRTPRAEWCSHPVRRPVGSQRTSFAHRARPVGTGPPPEVRDTHPTTGPAPFAAAHRASYAAGAVVSQPIRWPVSSPWSSLDPVTNRLRSAARARRVARSAGAWSGWSASSPASPAPARPAIASPETLLPRCFVRGWVWFGSLPVL